MVCVMCVSSGIMFQQDTHFLVLGYTHNGGYTRIQTGRIRVREAGRGGGGEGNTRWSFLSTGSRYEERPPYDLDRLEEYKVTLFESEGQIR